MTDETCSHKMSDVTMKYRRYGLLNMPDIHRKQKNFPKEIPALKQGNLKGKSVVAAILCLRIFS